MDAIEAARRVAAQLHDEAVAAGDNNCSLLDFVLAEANRRDIEVYPIAEGDPQLKGGKAAYDSHAWIILYEDIGSDFDKAFLIAHEIGHVVLEGDAEDSVANDTESDRTTEAPAGGAERVVDYGSRERREVTMDLFSSEFLVPRTVVKRWHIEENLSSEAIAVRLGAPLMIVQQQLIDALLLPVIQLKPRDSNENESTSVPLDPSQSKAACHRGAPFQLQAGPGTGKTRTLVHRIETLLNDGVDPGAIMVLTFSNKAAGELRDRIAVKFPEAVATLWLGTFHSFGLDIVHRFHDRLGLSGSPRVVTRYEAIDLLEDEIARLPLKHFRNLYDPTLDLGDMLNAISRAKDEVADSAHYKVLAIAMMDSATNEKQLEHAEKCNDVADLYEVYERLLKETDSVDFGDLVSLPVKLVEGDAEVRNLLSKRHQHILVDEYQDVNRASVRLLKAIAGDGKQLWVVGDARQSIYRFRGASSINMKRFTQDFPDAKVQELNVNYRSSSEIVNLYRQFSADMKASQGALPLDLTSSRGASLYLPELRVAGTPDDEIASIAAEIEEKKKQGFDYKEQAVLCTSNKRLSEIAANFEKLGLPVLYLGSLFERDEIKDVLSILSLVTDRYATGLIRTSMLPGFELPLNQLSLVHQHLREGDYKPLDWRELPDDISGLTEEMRDVLTRLSENLDGFQKNGNPWSILATLIIDRFEFAKQVSLGENLDAQMRGIALWQLLNFCRKPISGKGLPIELLLARIRRITLLSEDRDVRQLPQAALGINGVRLMTIHASKGLEFKVVHLPGMVVSGLPANNKPSRCIPPNGLIEGSEEVTALETIKAGHEEEEECKFFVAASRAEDRLLLYSSSVQNNGKKRKLSKYIDRIESAIIHNKSPLLLSVESKSVEVLSVDTEELTITERQLSLYDRCPRRFFYAHALALSGRKQESAFMQMHSAVYEVLDWLRVNYPDSTPSIPELEDQYTQSWQNKGPTDHGYADDYRQIGQRFLEYLIETRQGLVLIKPEALTVSFPDGEVSFIPDEVALDSDGNHRIRCIKTGKKSKEEFDRIEYSILLEGATKRYGPGVIVEAVHLASETQVQVTLTERKKATRLQKTEQALSSIANGYFPAKRENRTCPRCPNFFICGKVPKGEVKIKSKM